MNRTIPACFAAALAATVWTQDAAAVTLYNPALGTVPEAQGWNLLSAGSFTQAVIGGVDVLDTTVAGAIEAGSAILAPSLFNTGTGFALDFSLKIDAESHAADNQRAGFSVIVTGADPTQALEIGFWQNAVFAYQPGFVPGAATAYDTGATTAYALDVRNGLYSLYGNGTLLLSGALANYTAFGLPYTEPGLLFFGDDTSRGQSISELGSVSVAALAVPEPGTVALLLGGLPLLAWRGRRRRPLD